MWLGERRGFFFEGIAGGWAVAFPAELEDRNAPTARELTGAN